ncbi:MAG TPA: nicotinamide riboside transporter PnuC [Puia sp.]|jgi:nicotinamide mononucleotide transporter|nr:nicotinamide riboside transporter PnuC [Puia sp.]
MHWDEFWRTFREQVAATDVLQWTAILFGVAEVLLARVNNILLYPAGIISTALTIYILLAAGLYAESFLNGYYLVMSIYGWWHWQKRRNEPPLPIGKTTRGEWLVVAAITVGGFALGYALLRGLTPSTVPGWDAWVSATAWAGTWLLARRKIENWVLLNISNLFAIPLLFYKQLPMFAALTVFLFIVACFGYFDWRKRFKQQAV